MDMKNTEATKGTEMECPFAIDGCAGNHNEAQDCTDHIHEDVSEEGARLDGDEDEFRALNR